MSKKIKGKMLQKVARLAEKEVKKSEKNCCLFISYQPKVPKRKISR